uniref:Uncharacterized protein n=1 Tax=Anguilla anguilla TaxID=7936 RepID=A0A0E9S4U2_ANGAN
MNEDITMLVSHHWNGLAYTITYPMHKYIKLTHQ